MRPQVAHRLLRSSPMPAADVISAPIRDFLSEGTRTGKVAWIANDGRPLAAPIWFVVDGDELVFTTAVASAKGRAITRDPRVVLVVDLEEDPYAFVQVQGEAVVSTDPGELLEMATRIGSRYMGADRAEEFGRRNGVPGEYVVRLRPTKVISTLDVTG